MPLPEEQTLSESQGERAFQVGISYENGDGSALESAGNSLPDGVDSSPIILMQRFSAHLNGDISPVRKFTHDSH